MKRSKQVLTPTEQKVMELLWREDRPLTSVDMIQLEEEWKNGYIHLLLRTLEQKGFIKVVGTVRYNNQYARSFVPCMNKGEYLALLAKDMGLGKESVSEIVHALIKDYTSEEKKKLVSELQKMVTMLKKESKSSEEITQ